LLIRKRYYMLFLILVFIVQLTKLVQFTKHNTFFKIPSSTSMHFATRLMMRRVAGLYSEITLSWKLLRIWHTFLLRMTDNMISQTTDLSTWDTLYRSWLMRPMEWLLNIVQPPEVIIEQWGFIPIQGVPEPNLRPATSYSEFSWCSSVPPGKWWGSTSN
jgi:hypothetical protein